MNPPKDKPRVLVVDDVEANIDVLVEVLGYGYEYELSAATNGQEALEVVAELPPDLILLDIMMPEMDGYEVCRRLKAEPATAKIPVIFITSMSEVGDEAEGFEVGAVDYIVKPISPPIVQARVRTHLDLANQRRACERIVEQQVTEIRQNQKSAIFMLGKAGHYHDDDTGIHIWRMASYARALAKAVGWSVEQQEVLLFAAPMHDTGKIGTPDAILKKPGKLTDEEWVVMRQHTVIGHGILSVSQTPLFRMAADIALHHHERWDGGGYPRKLAGETIPEAARITAISDVFDALTMKRPYKEAWPLHDALDYIANSQGHFEPRLVERFLSIQDELVAIMDYWNQKQRDQLFIADLTP
ncbi:MAG: response regulator [Gammaproteobacteria bacterium]|nr:response regulator [Gammaproteobacteria bacterium]